MDRNHLLTRKYEPSRRILAVFCVICIAVMQCFVILPVVTEEVHAAEDVDFRANYSTDVSVSQGDKNWITGVREKPFDTVDTEGNPITVNGALLSKVLSKANLDGNNVCVNGVPVGNPSDYVLVKEGGAWMLYDKAGIYVDNVDLIEADLNKAPVKLTKASADKKKAYKGEEVTISYTLEVDSFFKNTDEYINNKEDILELNWNASNSKVSPETTTTNSASGSFKVKVKKSGEVTISPEAGDPELIDVGSKTVTLSGKKPKLVVKPKSVSIKERESKTCTVKYNGQSVLGTSCTWTSKSNSIATVSASGLIWGVKAGKTTVTVKYKGLTVSVPVTVKQAQTTTYSRPSYSSYHRPSYSYTRSSLHPTTGTGATSRTTATRPLATETTETAQTAAPSFQTMTVKEVYLTPMEEDPYSDDGGEEDWEDEGWDEEDSEEDYDDDGVSFPAAAGSAAVAVAACGAGAVGRVRKFHADMGGAVIAGAVKAAGDGKRKFRSKKKDAEALEAEEIASEAKAAEAKAEDKVDPEVSENEPKAEEGKKAKGLRGKFRKK